MSVGTSQLLSTSEMLNITNGAGRAFDLVDPLLGTGIGTLTGGYWGQQVLGRVVGLSGTYYGLSDKYKHANVDAGAQNFADYLSSDGFWPGAVSSLMSGLNSNMAGYGKYLSTTITELDSYATYQNGASANSMLYCSSFAKLYWYYRNKAAMLSATNILGPQVVLASGTVTGTIAITFTNGVAINTISTVTAGIQGYYADIFEMVITSGTFTGTIAGTGTDQIGTAAYWDIIASGYTSAGTAIQATPRVAGKRTTDITAISYSGDGTAATLNLRSVARDLTL